ncbi:hypothetical protein ANCCAN_20295 [Ancylostoma caninum]|uniref:Origin recognition complex subunit 3 N-terminal domain-containing protein n=1 Tax=Ancylostoma caninum TaxID=29170 RepID=A0A368FNS2_ANCCA|nr:hypothetical protein ANCCAN_20295 [Ancylostoma caninum]
MNPNLQDQECGPRFLRAKDIASLDSFDEEIDRNVRQIFNGVLEQIVDFFLSSPPQREDVFRRKLLARKVKTAIVQCSAADVNRLIDGVLGRMSREIGEHVVVKSGQADIHEVVSKFEGCSGKRKQLLVIEQAESLSSKFLNGLFYSLPSLRCDIIILLCVSTKQIMFTSRVSRRCLALLHARRFLFSLSPEVFYNLVTNVLFNPPFTDLRLQAGFLRFIRCSFLRDEFSVAHLKKCIRFALLHRLWMNRSPDPLAMVTAIFIGNMDEYFGALNFLNDNFHVSCESKERNSELIALHEDVQAAGFLGIANSSKYRDWTQSVSRMSETDIKRMMDHKGIRGYNIKLDVPDQSDVAVQREADPSKLLSSKPLTEKTSVLQLKNKMKEIIAARQLNPQLLARQRLIREVEVLIFPVLFLNLLLKWNEPLTSPQYLLNSDHTWRGSDL